MKALDDTKIIDLFFERDETAIRYTSEKYGNRLRSLSHNIVKDRQTAEECENDTYLKIWNSIPPNNPENFKAYIGKITRNIALDIWKKNHTQKRNAGIEILFSEMEDILSVPQTDTEYELEEITPIINKWLLTLKQIKLTIILVKTLER